jgi:HPt (histidine-containing phosphotransfer) domain-containing protein
MTDSMDSFRSQLAELRERWLTKLPAAVLELEQTWGLLAAGHPPESVLLATERLAHRLASSSATFGLRELSAGARSLESALRTAQEAEAGAEAELFAEVVRHLTSVGLLSQALLRESSRLAAASALPGGSSDARQS